MAREEYLAGRFGKPQAAVGKSFVDGRWVKASALSAAQRSGVRGSHKAAVGMTEDDAKFKVMRQLDARNTANTAGVLRDARRSGHVGTDAVRSKGRRVVVHRMSDDFAEGFRGTSGLHGLMAPPAATANASQRMARRRVLTSAEWEPHEMAHATVRKPLSAQVRRQRARMKGDWGPTLAEEARADSRLSSAARAKSGYPAMSRLLGDAGNRGTGRYDQTMDLLRRKGLVNNG